MPDQRLSKTELQNLIARLSKIQSIRQESLKILVDVDKKASDYKLREFRKKLEEITNES